MDPTTYLPEEIQEKIVKEHSPSFGHLVSFFGVCRSWKSMAKDHLFNISPGILVSKTSCPREQCFHDVCSCFDCRTGKPLRCQRRINSTNSRVRVPHHQFRPISALFDSNISSRRVMWCRKTKQIRLPVKGESFANVDLEKCHCVASKDGWLVLVETRDSVPLRIYLLNPITGASIPVFRLKHDKYRSHIMVRHVILTSSPEKHDCHLIVLSDHRDSTPGVAWCKVNGGSWNYTWTYSRFFDRILCACYFGRKLYVVDSIVDRYSAMDGRISVHVLDNLINVTEDDEAGPPPPPPPPSPRPRSRRARRARRPRPSHPTARTLKLPCFGVARQNWTTRYYAMELNCQLIIVICHRCCNGDDVEFQVYKLVYTTYEKGVSYCWKEVSSLDGHAAFLGTHQCFCVPVKDDGMNIKRDHIYYLNNGCGQCALEYAHRNVDYGPGLDCGVFSLEDRKIVEHSHLAADNYQDYTWFLPMPWDIHKQSNDEKNKNKNKKKPRKPKENHETNDGLNKCSSSKMTDRNRLLLERASDLPTPCHNSFESLLLGD
ncbi:hypothetical protein LINGRAHAP2_LOCUS13396 [Linum grandiflorum]